MGRQCLGGSRWDRKSTSGGVVKMGVVKMWGRCVKIWSTTHAAVALSTAESEFYPMVDAVQRAKWLVAVAKELGFEGMAGHMVLGTDSSAAKNFVSRRGLGKMRHIEVRKLWLRS